MIFLTIYQRTTWDRGPQFPPEVNHLLIAMVTMALTQCAPSPGCLEQKG